MEFEERMFAAAACVKRCRNRDRCPPDVANCAARLSLTAAVAVTTSTNTDAAVTTTTTAATH